MKFLKNAMTGMERNTAPSATDDCFTSGDIVPLRYVVEELCLKLMMEV